MTNHIRILQDIYNPPPDVMSLTFFEMARPTVSPKMWALAAYKRDFEMACSFFREGGCTGSGHSAWLLRIGLTHEVQGTRMLRSCHPQSRCSYHPQEALKSGPLKLSKTCNNLTPDTIKTGTCCCLKTMELFCISTTTR